MRRARDKGLRAGDGRRGRRRLGCRERVTRPRDVSAEPRSHQYCRRTMRAINEHALGQAHHHYCITTARGSRWCCVGAPPRWRGPLAHRIRLQRATSSSVHCFLSEGFDTPPRAHGSQSLSPPGDPDIVSIGGRLAPTGPAASAPIPARNEKVIRKHGAVRLQRVPNDYVGSQSLTTTQRRGLAAASRCFCFQIPGSLALSENAWASLLRFLNAAGPSSASPTPTPRSDDPGTNRTRCRRRTANTPDLCPPKIVPFWHTRSCILRYVSRRHLLVHDSRTRARG
ncbi:hypothetical protein K458DRAFT_453763 [Lentithecium fluviatile CBS 122367]|uniref:Uncharacterized protein n=1 Tax=Lentithecium fluviatile CBS 122367 TaxID=1168545 RepID=A0A6G1IWY5_9PLEO|nr:hypothetical protein K458DRAFT_453763 [Lentithecium fluviatile CBS 122367]